MISIHKAISSALLSVVLIGSQSALGQDQPAFPVKPIRIVVPFAAGSGADADSRFYGELLAHRIGQPVTVENRPGASGVIAVRSVKAAPADGYTVLIATSSPMSVNAVTIKDLPYDPFVDFKPLVGVAVNPAGFVVRGDSPHRNLQDVVASIRDERRPLAVGNYSVGYQLMATWLGTASKIDITHVNYRGASQMITDIVGGQLELAVTDPSAILGMHNDGRVRVIATTGVERMTGLSEVPTMIESGFSDFETYIWSSFFVREETPAEVTDWLIENLSAVMKTSEAETYRKERGQMLLDLKGEEMRRFQRQEFERFKKVAESVNFQKQ